MYLGFYNSKCSLKNQLTFPGKFEKDTGKSLFIANWFENSLLVLPAPRAESIISKIISNNSTLLPEARDLERFIYANAISAELDAKNRFVINKKLRDYARIGKTAVFVGVGERIELWDEEMYVNYGEIHELTIRDTAISLYQRIISQNKKP